MNCCGYLLLSLHLMTVQPETVSKKQDLPPFMSLISVTWVSPRPRPFRRQEAVLSPFFLMGEMNMITDYDQFFHPIITDIHIGPVFHKTHILWTFWHKNGIFRHTIQEKINFVENLSLSQQHILTRFGNRCFQSCFTTDINGHLNGLIGRAWH